MKLRTPQTNVYNLVHDAMNKCGAQSGLPIYFQKAVHASLVTISYRHIELF